MANPKAKQNGALEDTVFSPPRITRHPSNQMVKEGSRLRLSVAASGVPVPRFRWRHNGSMIDGVIGNVLVVPQVRHSHAGNYTVEAYNVAGTDLSRPASVSILKVVEEEVIEVTISPSRIEAISGKAFVFTAEFSAKPKGPCSYQWFKDGKRIRDATARELRVARAKEKYVGDYVVVVETEAGLIQSSPASLVLREEIAPETEAPTVADALVEPQESALVAVVEAPAVAPLETSIEAPILELMRGNARPPEEELAAPEPLAPTPTTTPTEFEPDFFDPADEKSGFVNFTRPIRALISPRRQQLQRKRAALEVLLNRLHVAVAKQTAPV